MSAASSVVAASSIAFPTPPRDDRLSWRPPPRAPTSGRARGGGRQERRSSRGGVGNAMDEAATTLEAADIAAILKALPHRYPFLMVDRIVGIRNDECAIGIKNVTYNEPQFLGHFPDNPVFPGVLMIEGMAQTAGVICIRSLGVAG